METYVVGATGRTGAYGPKRLVLHVLELLPRGIEVLGEPGRQHLGLLDLGHLGEAGHIQPQTCVTQTVCWGVK